MASPRDEVPAIRVLKNVLQTVHTQPEAEVAVHKIVEASSADMGQMLHKLGLLAVYAVSSPEWRSVGPFSSLTPVERTQWMSLYYPQSIMVQAPEPTIEEVRAVVQRAIQPNDSRVSALRGLVERTDSISYLRAAVESLREKVPQVDTMLAFAIYAAAKPQWRTTSSPLTATQRKQVWSFFPDLHPEETARVEAAAQQAAGEAVAEMLGKSSTDIAREMINSAANVEVLNDAIARAADPITKMSLERSKADQLRNLAAAAVSAKLLQAKAAGRVAPFDVVSITPVQAQARIAQVNARITAIRAQIPGINKALSVLPVGTQRCTFYTNLLALQAELNSLRQRLTLLKQNKDRAVIGNAQVANRRKPIVLKEGASPEISPELLATIVFYLVSRMPRRPGESRRQFLLRLRIYLKRALARYAANATQGEPPVTAAETAAVATVVEDTPVIEAEVTAGGEASDPAAEAMTEVADAASPVMEEAVDRAALGLAENSSTDEFINAEAAQAVQAPAQVLEQPVVEDTQPVPEIPSTPVAVDTAAQLVAMAPQADPTLTAVVEAAQLAMTLPPSEDEAVLEDVAPEHEVEPEPWYKNKLVWAGGALAAIFALRS